MRTVKSNAKEVIIRTVRRGTVCCFFTSAAILGLLATYVPGSQNLGAASPLNGPAVLTNSPLTPAQIDCGGFGSTIDCVDVSPSLSTFSPQIRDNWAISVFGKILSLAVSADGQRLYAGAFSGVWRSDNRGETWRQLTRPQPPFGTNDVPRALLVPNVFDLAVSPENKDVVLAATAIDTRIPSESKNGIYRSTDGGESWRLVHQFKCPGSASAEPVGQIVFAPGDFMPGKRLVYAAGGCAVAISEDGGETWDDKPIKEGTNVGTVWHLAVAPLDANFVRRVYAAGPNQLWYSTDGGDTWLQDKGKIPPSETCCPKTPFGVLGDFPSEGFQSSSARILAVEPGHPDHVFLAVPSIMNGPAYYFYKDNVPGTGVVDGTPCDSRKPPFKGPGCGGGTLWMGDYSTFSQTRSARWELLPGPPAYFGGFGAPDYTGGSTPSGRVFVVVHPLPTSNETRPYLLFFGDTSHVHVSLGRPKVSAAFNLTSDWHRLDGRDASQSKLDNNLANKLFVHVDPHALVVSPDLNISLKPAEGMNSCNNIGVDPCYNLNSVLDPDKPIVGMIWMANDGGVYRNTDFRSPTSTDDGMNWKLGDNLATLAAQYPFAGVAVLGKPPALYFGVPDNDNFFSTDGGMTWNDPVTGCGDCSAWIADPAQPDRVVEFNRDPSLSLYINKAGDYPNAGEEVQRHGIPLPDLFGGARTAKGYRPLILTTKDKPDDTDFVLIRLNPATGVIGRVLRTERLSEISSATDWDQTKGPKVFQQGPDFTSDMNEVDVVQVSGGHESPVFYVGDSNKSPFGLWKWPNGMSVWRQIVPSPPETPPERSAKMARRFFVNPYDPSEIYIIDESAIKRSVDGGSTWQTDTSLDRAVTEDGRFGYGITRLTGSSNSIIDAVIKDMVFVRGELTRFAVGTAGVFLSFDGENWERLLSTSALPGHPTAAYFDSISNPSDRMLYVALAGRGILRLGPIRTADLSITKSDSPDPVTTGNTLAYTLTIINRGPDAAASVTVTDNLPAETTFVSCSSTGSGVCSGSGNNRTVTFASLASGESETITFVATVSCSVADGTVISNTATVSSSTLDPDLSNNSRTATTTASNSPPTIIGASANPSVLWPPNHRLENVAVNYEVTDNCPLPANSCTLGVTSNEPINGTGDGNTSPDWIVLDANHVQLRAERAGNGNGRIYTIGITCVDSGGNSSHQGVEVSVPHGQGKK